MLTRALIIVGLLTAALVALTLAVMSGGRPATEADADGRPIVAQPVWNIVALSITPASDRSPGLALERRRDGVWIFASDGWPANDAAVRATLRLLSEPRVEGRAEPLRDATRITLRFEDGAETTLSLERGEAAVGGRALLANERGAYGAASVELAQALGDIRPDAWRSPMAMPRVEAESSRITIELSGGERVSLARVAGRWSLREPLRARADERRVGALLSSLIDLRVQRFASPEDAGAATPDAGAATLRSIVVETDRRSLEGADNLVRTETETTALQVRGALDDAGESVLCEVDGVSLVVRGEALARLPLDAAHFVARGSLGSAPADIGMLALRDAQGREGAFRRAVLSWQALGDEAERLLNPADDPGAIDLLLQFLAYAEPTSVRLTPGADANDDESTARFYGLGDDERGFLGFRWERAERGRTLVVREAEIERRYAESQAPRLLRAWLDRE